MTNPSMKKRNGPKTGKNRRWFKRKVRELGKALERLPADRRAAFEKDLEKKGSVQ